LQSFGHAAVAEDGTLEIKLMGIDGRVMYEKTLTPPVEDNKGDSPTPGTSSAVIPSALLAVAAFSVTFLYI